MKYISRKDKTTCKAEGEFPQRYKGIHNSKIGKGETEIEILKEKQFGFTNINRQGRNLCTF